MLKTKEMKHLEEHTTTVGEAGGEAGGALVKIQIMSKLLFENFPESLQSWWIVMCTSTTRGKHM